LGLDTMQAGGIINITAQEVCTFSSSTISAGYFCYDNLCGPAATGTTAGLMETAVNAVVDSNGDAVVAGATAALADTNNVVVTLPIGKSCDGLEMRGTSAAITKTVNKHNNGKSFKITRSFLQSTMVPTATLAAQLVTCAAAAQTASAGCAQAVANVDSVVISNVGATAAARCGALKAATDGADYPMSRTITGSTPHATDGTRGLAVAAIDVTANVATANCATRVARHVITLDSMPTASATSTAKTLLYTSPVGSCSVAETTKGTYESYECSNRGACDGKSGLCTCYEGYSGQSCQTQTVLV
jgi:hypothetical protein